MLVSIARALEQRDQSFGHGDRVAALAEPVALELGWDQERIRSLRRSAPLHDVGKVTLSPQLLGKNGPLTLEEMAEIRRHPEAGAQLVLPLRRFHEALPYVLFHHERWDGGGYPDALAADAIPLGARIVAVCDAYETMTSDRVYHAGITPAKARAELIANAGTQFDPAVVHAFCSLPADQVGPTERRAA